MDSSLDEEFSGDEFDEILRCTAPWNACGVDSANYFPIKKRPPIRKTVFELFRKVVEKRMIDGT